MATTSMAELAASSVMASSASREDKGDTGAQQGLEEGASADWTAPPSFHPPSSTSAPVLLVSITPRDALSSSEVDTSSLQRQRRGPSQDFWRRAKWSPDGTHVLLQAESHTLNLFALSGGNGQEHKLVHVLTAKAPTALLDAVWYPFATYSDPATWCFAMSARDVPVRLIDAYSGKLRATYPIEDHVERFVGPHALAFSLDGTHLYAGHGSSLSIFTLSLPGCPPRTMALTPTRRAHEGVDVGQRGMVSALAVATNCSADAEGEELIAVGTFAGTVGIYAPSRGRKTSVCLAAGWREEDGRGVTQLSFHPTAPYLLFIASRQSSMIIGRDTRYLSAAADFYSFAPQASLWARFERTAPDASSTAQRLSFDVDWAGRWLVAGDETGNVRMWSVRVSGASFADEGEVEEEDEPETLVRLRSPRGSWQAAKDAIGGVILHPLLPIVLTVSGARHWDDDGGGSTSDDSSEHSCSDSDACTAELCNEVSLSSEINKASSCLVQSSSTVNFGSLPLACGACGFRSDV